MTTRLTELACARAKPTPGRRIEKYDGVGGVPGLALRITERGVKSWSVYYRIGGKLRRLTLGRFPDLGLAEARRRARQALEHADRGVDPAGDRGERRPGRDTVTSVAADFMERHVKRNHLRSAHRIEQMLHRVVLAWGPRPIQSIIRRDVLDLIDDVAIRAPVQANRLQAQIKRLLGWAVERGILEANPIVGLRAPAKERARDRVLSDAELTLIWRAVGELGWPWSPIIRLLALTGARRSEVSGMAWNELAPDRRSWVKPAARTKAGRVHELPLSSAALDIITGLPRVDGSPWVFPARIGPGHTVSLGAAKRRLDELSGVSGWRIHDLRRTTASGMARLGAAPHIVGAILDHSPASLIGVTAVYQRHRFQPEQRAALELWAGHVLDLAEGSSAKVIAINRY